MFQNSFFFKGLASEDAIFLYLSPYCIVTYALITLVFTSEILCIAKVIWGFSAGLLSSSSGRKWRNTAFSSLLSFRLSVASCCCHCSCFQQQQLLQAAIAMDDATGILLHSLKRPILLSAYSGDRTVKRHEPYKYMWLLWVSSDMKHHPQRLLATRNGSSYVGRQVPFGADFWLWSAASREQYSPSTIPISILPVAEITVRRQSDQIPVRFI